MIGADEKSTLKWALEWHDMSTSKAGSERYCASYVSWLPGCTLLPQGLEPMCLALQQGLLQQGLPDVPLHGLLVRSPSAYMEFWGTMEFHGES